MKKHTGCLHIRQIDVYVQRPAYNLYYIVPKHSTSIAQQCVSYKILLSRNSGKYYRTPYRRYGEMYGLAYSWLQAAQFVFARC